MTNIPGGQPVTNPVTTYNPAPTGGDPATTPVVGPPGTATNAPAVPGQSWCVARSGAPRLLFRRRSIMRVGLEVLIVQPYSRVEAAIILIVCKIMHHMLLIAITREIQCQLAVTLVAPVLAFSQHCHLPQHRQQRHLRPQQLQYQLQRRNLHPEQHLQGAPPTVLNGSNPGLGGGISGYGESPLTGDPSSVSISSSLQPFIGCIIVVTTIITGTTKSDQKDVNRRMCPSDRVPREGESNRIRLPAMTPQYFSLYTGFEPALRRNASHITSVLTNSAMLLGQPLL
ncbi:hypothetical protein DH2020_045201 [Rehmannia glutinosa]|uniref:Uncharacterized protein n=1 Tax=Rehmannia glutinosa TaxID=99300 RepID=A0ABR0UFS3_REHGL